MIDNEVFGPGGDGYYRCQCPKCGTELRTEGIYDEPLCISCSWEHWKENTKLAIKNMIPETFTQIPQTTTNPSVYPTYCVSTESIEQRLSNIEKQLDEISTTLYVHKTTHEKELNGLMQKLDTQHKSICQLLSNLEQINYDINYPASVLRPGKVKPYE